MSEQSRHASDHIQVSDSASATTHHHRQTSEHIAVSDSATAVFLQLAPAIARSAATLDLTVGTRAVAELTSEQLATWARLKRSAGAGLAAGGLTGGFATASSGNPWWAVGVPVAGAVGGVVIGERLHDSPVTTRLIAAITNAADRRRH